MSSVSWYLRRAAAMSPAEVAWRARDQLVQLAWSRRQVRPGPVPQSPAPQSPASQGAVPQGADATLAPSIGANVPSARLGMAPTGHRRQDTRQDTRQFTAVLPAGTAGRVPKGAREAVLAAADKLMLGEWELFGLHRTDLADPDWFLDPVTGERSDPSRYAFRTDRRSGNIKHVWEPSRLQHLTLLATAWYLSGEDRYAERVAAQLNSWWRQNPFLSGIHWTSGIELGIRLISFAWIRRLLDGWPGVKGLFDDNPVAVAQLGWHCEYLAAFRSKGTSANNHVIAEASGLLAGACAFDWFANGAKWRRRAAAVLETELTRNTFDDGVGRELATDYQCFVAELGILAAAEAEAAGYSMSPALWRRLCATVDACAAMVDSAGRPPRQGDSDEGRAILLDAPADNRFPGLLRLGDELFGRLDWWPHVEPAADAASVLIGALASGHRAVPGRPATRTNHFRGAGITLLRDGAIWCRCDGGPHGFLSIAAHAHADALSLEVRHDGVDVLADPGTYCYHGEPEYRSYFRSTLAHNTVEVAGRDQSRSGGPFLWLRHAKTRELEVTEDSWTAEHDGYSGIGVTHRRTVRLNREASHLEITDTITGGTLPRVNRASGGENDLRLAFHLGPDVHAELDGPVARLRWPGTDGLRTATMRLPSQLSWSAHRGETGPVLGWYSAGLGRRTPSTTLIGSGRCPLPAPLCTRLEFDSAERTTDLSRSTIHAEAR